MTPHANERRRMATLALAVGAILALAAAGVSAFDAQRLQPPRAAGAVLPGFSASAGTAEAINIVTKDAAYHIVRTERGWVLRDRGDFPIARERLAQFTNGLSTLSYVRPMTRDPAKIDRLGLGDPAKGGDGVLVQVQTGQGALLANLVLGMAPSGIYLRVPDKDQAWAVSGSLPPLKDPAQWLDLAPLSLDPARIMRSVVQPATGPAFVLARDSASGDFKLEAPFDRFLVLTPAGLNATGQAFATLQPIDVAAAPAITGAPSARVTARTGDGLAIEGEVFEQGGRRWLKVVARGETPAAITEAQAINTRAAAWAYALGDVDYSDLTPALAVLARSPSAPPPATSP